MSSLSASGIFIASVALTAISSFVLARDLDRLGARLRLSEGLMGLITALGANAPEISSSVVALLHRERDIGIGVVVGSNLFNLAALMGLSAVIAGHVRISRAGLILNGGVAVVVTGVLLALVVGAIGPGVSVVAIGAVMVPYVALMALHPERLHRRVPEGRLRDYLIAATEHAQRDARTGQTPRRAIWIDYLTMIPAITSIVLGSIGMVNSATILGRRWGWSDAIIGTLILAALTSLPNVLTAVRLALHRRGSAVVSEALNSNTLNILAGICLPALFLGLGAASQLTLHSTYWLMGLTLLTLLLTWMHGGLYRWEGSIIIAAYLAFVALVAAR